MDMITVEKRDFAVKAKKLRRLGLVPGSVFGSLGEGYVRFALVKTVEEMKELVSVIKNSGIIK